ncbi:MAG: histone deacetylase [Spirochaetota bacterium]
MVPTAYLFDPVYMDHDTGWGHPERPERLAAIDQRLRQQTYYKSLIKVEPKIGAKRYIELVHSPEYIERVKQEIESGIHYLDSMDTAVCKRSYEVALFAVGGSLNMCDTIMSGEAIRGFCAVRPPGHHAEYDYAAGFCIFNNIAIAAKYLQVEHGLKKVAIVDWDVHHGNGTQHTFERDKTVMYISTHQYPHYPGTGARSERGKGEGEGYTLNFPMPAGSGEPEYLDVFKNQIVPALTKFEPDIILISAGFDAHNADPLSYIGLTSESYYKFTVLLKQVANEFSGGRMIAFLEGGYDLEALAGSVDMMMRGFIED